MRTDRNVASVLREEVPLWISGATSILFLVFGETWLADLSNLSWFALNLSMAFQRARPGSICGGASC
jgi:hypothetical protein